MKETTPAWLAAGILMASTLAASGAEAPIVIAHRGASGERPEHTLAAYELGIAQGADFVEPDLVATKDAVLVCRHENEISSTTDVASRPEFAARRTTKTIDGTPTTGWFTEDFTLAELRTLRARERLPQLRGTAFDGRFGVPTFEELLALVAATNARPDRRGRALGVYPETKHPSYFEGLGLALEKPLLDALRRHGLDRADAPVFIQSFEVSNLRRLAALTRVPLVQLVEPEGRPWDFTLGRFARTYADMLRPEGLRDIAAYARGIGVHKNLVLPRGGDERLLPPTPLVRDAHAAGLLVHVFTLRAENQFLPAELRRGPSLLATGDVAIEAELFLKAGVDGFFIDQPAIGVKARDAFLRRTAVP
ncbi:MAG TPA: glycerophosphodiester phosphodiesterase [Vicinamibacteria bacterium]|nr:glycerophosphodiester phosphodiesterase [Vicinamibacteria bacterium]